MTLALVAHAVVAGWWVPRTAQGSDWARRDPICALTLLGCAVLGFGGAVAGLMLLVSHDVIEFALVHALQGDMGALHESFAGVVAGASWWWAAATVLGAVLLVVGDVAASCWRARPHDAALRGAGRARPELGNDVVVVASSRAGIWSLRGRGPGVVVTTAAMSALSSVELSAALAHERAHIARRHHILVMAATGLSRRLGWCGAFAPLAALVSELVELDADDVAARQCGARTVALALLRLGSVDAGPRTALGMGSSSTGRRITRLVDPGYVVVTHSERLVRATYSAWVIAVPAMLMALPGLALGHSTHTI
ncbi:M56 family metallopeptidase [Nocardioides aurantiacus]|uniref:Zn-dependent protease with chaperone function n=1 Tax=Nocardioides aurantiacus TaxID=86796 RepID=A0A3N2CWJ6_9ACTN|nr:M56 family metallopeptidase [Nocardioides aurantiacus]ROR91846.1 Zn-dependent protease with chaperone function [Nocardioides aurantiacus]